MNRSRSAVLVLAVALAAPCRSSAQLLDFDRGAGGAGLSPRAAEGVPAPEGRAIDDVRYVRVRVAALRNTTTPYSGTGVDRALDTQLLAGERVRVLRQQGDLLYVEVPDQRSAAGGRDWHGYYGWVAAADVTSDPAAAARPRRPPADLRAAFLTEARRLEGVPYLWGGRSDAGVDCSGLVHLAMTRAGRPDLAPRDSADIHRASRPVEPGELQPGDFVFFASTVTARVSHVAIYNGGGELLEAPQTGMNVRRIPLEERTGLALARMSQGRNDGRRIYYFGRLLPD